MSENTLRVFVYGTLKEGGRFASCFDSRRLSVKEGAINGSMFSVSGAYPAVIFGGDSIIHGEVHEFADDDAKDVQNHMDGIEGFVEGRDGNLYNRITVDIQVGDELIECETYEYNSELEALKKRMKQIEDGTWEI